MMQLQRDAERLAETQGVKYSPFTGSSPEAEPCQYRPGSRQSEQSKSDSKDEQSRYFSWLSSFEGETSAGNFDHDVDIQKICQLY